MTLPLYDHHSPSSLNLFAAEPSVWVLEKILGLKQTVSPSAHRGAAVEDGVTAGLQDLDCSLQDCTKVALQTYDRRMAFSGDPRKDKYRETISDMIGAALYELRQYGKPTGTQGKVSWHPDGLRFPIMGYYDYEWANHGILADLKTTERMPSEIKFGHARQVALYAGSDNVDARLIYVTPKKLEAYKLENIGEHRNALASIAKRVENLLDLSDDPQFFVSITVPDLDSFYWSPPLMRQLAYEHWGV